MNETPETETPDEAMLDDETPVLLNETGAASPALLVGVLLAAATAWLLGNALVFLLKGMPR